MPLATVSVALARNPSAEAPRRRPSLEKALYELGYEFDDRPEGVRIPIRGILGLVNAGSQ
jgi:predicted trehalose synthase